TRDLSGGRIPGVCPPGPPAADPIAGGAGNPWVYPGGGVVRGPALGSGTKLIARPRLLARLGERWKVAVLAAPAGYGKTLLAAQFTGGHGAQVVWCRLYPEDRDPLHLIGSLLAAGGRPAPPPWRPP